MFYVPFKANNLHPLWVVVDKHPFSGGPLLPQTTNVQVFILHCQPLSFEACGWNEKAKTDE